MTRLREQIVTAPRVLPDTIQDELARILLQPAGVDHPAIRLSADEEAALDHSLAEAERGDFASDGDIRALWAKHRRRDSGTPAARPPT